jgi:hypothetical protein
MPRTGNGPRHGSEWEVYVDTPPADNAATPTLLRWVDHPT